MADQVSPAVGEDVNARLNELSQTIFGDKIVLRVVDPKSIRLLKKNARWMKKATFDQLTSNVKTDGQLESVPLCHTLAESGELECLSGNHRVQAAAKAGLDKILVMVIPHELSKEQKISRQLSHNALSGQDDLTILSELWAEIGTLQERLYAGLDSELIGELEKIKFQGFAAEPIRTESLTMWFLPEEVEILDKLVDAYQKTAVGSTLYMAPLSHYEKLWKAIAQMKKSGNVKNTAVAFMLLIDALADKPMPSTVMFTPEQMTIVKGAIAKVRDAEDGPADATDGRILELICADYLSGAPVESAGPGGGAEVSSHGGSFDPSPALQSKKHSAKPKRKKK